MKNIRKCQFFQNLSSTQTPSEADTERKRDSLLSQLMKDFSSKKKPKKREKLYFFLKFRETDFHFGKCFFFIEKRKDDSSPKKRVNSKQNVPKSSPVNSLDYGVLCPCCDRVFQDLSSAVSILMAVPSYFISCNYQF